MLAQRLERYDVERALVRRGEDDVGRRAVAVGSQPVDRGHAPAVARLEAGEAVRGHGRAQVVADLALVLQELRRDDRAEGVAAAVVGPRAAAAVAVEARERVGSARLELAAEDVAGDRAHGPRTVPLGSEGMAVPRLRVPSQSHADHAFSSEEVELYHRTYTTLLRSSGETLVRVLEPSHRSMNSSLHPLAASEDLDLGAFLYATQRLPREVPDAKVIVMGQEAKVFSGNGIGPIEEWEPLEAPARRRRWFHDGSGMLAVLLASASDLDDLIPTLVAYQIEWNKLRVRQRALDWPRDGDPSPLECAEALGGSEADWSRLRDAWGEGFGARLRDVAERRLNLRVRMLGGSAVGYARMTRRWWRPVRATLAEQALEERPIYFVSSNAHSIVNLLTGTARAREREICEWVDASDDPDLKPELDRFRAGEAEGSWENFLYFAAREYFSAQPVGSDIFERRSAEERAVGVTHLSSRTALRVSAQVICLDRLDHQAIDPRLGVTDAARLAACPAVIVNVEYPLGLAAYNI